MDQANTPGNSNEFPTRQCDDEFRRPRSLFNPFTTPMLTSLRDSTEQGAHLFHNEHDCDIILRLCRS